MIRKRTKDLFEYALYKFTLYFTYFTIQFDLANRRFNFAAIVSFKKVLNCDQKMPSKSICNCHYSILAIILLLVVNTLIVLTLKFINQNF